MTDPTTASTSYWTQIRTHAAPPATAPGAAAALAAAADPTLSLEIGMLRLALVRLVEEEADAGRFAQGVARLVAASVQASRLQRELTAATEQARREAEMRHSLEALDRDFGSAAYQPPWEEGGWPDHLGGQEALPPAGRAADSTDALLPIEDGVSPAVPGGQAAPVPDEIADRPSGDLPVDEVIAPLTEFTGPVLAAAVRPHPAADPVAGGGRATRRRTDAPGPRASSQSAAPDPPAHRPPAGSAPHPP